MKALKHPLHTPTHTHLLNQVCLRVWEGRSMPGYRNRDKKRWRKRRHRCICMCMCKRKHKHHICIFFFFVLHCKPHPCFLCSKRHKGLRLYVPSRLYGFTFMAYFLLKNTNRDILKNVSVRKNVIRDWYGMRRSKSWKNLNCVKYVIYLFCKNHYISSL